MENLVNDCVKQIRAAQRSHRASGNTVGAVAAYDKLLDEMLSEFEAASDDERKAIQAAMSREGSGLLLGAAEGSAMWAVRENNPERLKVGLASLLVENLKEDYRETLIGLTLLHNTARKLSTDLEAKYNDVRHFGAPEAIELFDSCFLEGGKTLDEMGYQECVDDNGEFIYARGW